MWMGGWRCADTGKGIAVARKRIRWTDAEREFIEDNYLAMSDKAMAAELPGRAPGSVGMMRKRGLKLERVRPIDAVAGIPDRAKSRFAKSGLAQDDRPLWKGYFAK